MPSKTKTKKVKTKKVKVNIGFLNIGQLGLLTPNIQNTLGNNMVRMGVFGGGSCFFHSVLEATNKTYQKLPNSLKREAGEQWRKRLANSLDVKYKEFGYDKTMKPAGITESVFKRLLKNVCEHVGDETWTYISDFLKINIIIYRLDSDSIYCSGLLLKKDIPTILSANIGDIHYEPIFQLKSDMTLVRTFSSKGNIFNKIVSDNNKNCSKEKIN